MKFYSFINIKSFLKIDHIVLSNVAGVKEKRMDTIFIKQISVNW